MCFVAKFIQFFSNALRFFKSEKANSAFITESILASGALIGLNQLWYVDYPKSDFHFINDNYEWMQMDILGHLFSSYNIGRFGAEALNCGKTSKSLF